jgi:hypothetical protein
MRPNWKLLWIGLATAACGATATPGTQGADAGPSDASAAAQAIKVDFLWMIDHSSSMAQAQRQLAKAFAGFAKKLGPGAGGKAIDAQMAVVSVQQIADSSEIKKVGQFLHKPATSLPPSAVERTAMACWADGDCTAPKCFKMYNADAKASMCPAEGMDCVTPIAMPAGNWYCNSSASSLQLNNQSNCSVNSRCQLRCEKDEDCYAVFEADVPAGGKHRVFCNNSVAVPGCMFPPETEDCPPQDKLPAVLKQSVAITDGGGNVVGNQLDWFRCSASLGANQSKQASFEGGLRSIWTALDPKGINCPAGPDGKPGPDCQYQQLVRPDAYLVLVAISNDDDCSYAFELPVGPDALKSSGCQMSGDRVAGNTALINGYCELMKGKDKSAGLPLRTCPADCYTLTAAAKADCETKASKSIADLVAANPGNQLKNANFASVADFVERFKSLKADPNQVLFATFTGDSLAEVGKGGMTAEQQRDLDRASYYTSALANQFGYPYICSGPRGESGFGSRYIGVASEFGSNGMVWNICKGPTLDDGMTAMAQWLRKRVQAD